MQQNVEDLLAEGDPAEELDDLYRDILKATEETGIELSGNSDFLDYALPYRAFFAYVFDDVRDAFLGDAGPIDTLEEVRTAMDALFQQRVDEFLEYIKYAYFPSIPEPETCSDETLSAWFALRDDWYAIQQTEIDLCNKEPFLLEVADFIRNDLEPQE